MKIRFEEIRQISGNFTEVVIFILRLISLFFFILDLMVMERNCSSWFEHRVLQICSRSEVWFSFESENLHRFNVLYLDGLHGQGRVDQNFLLEFQVQ